MARADVASDASTAVASTANIDPKVAFMLAAKFAGGYGVAKDDRRAVEWYRIAAEKGFPPAQNNLGFMYAEGRGVKKDDAQAVQWYQRAADQNYAPAQTSLGMMYAQGRGVEKSDTDALALYSMAAKDGYPQAMANLGKMYADGQGVARDKQMGEFLIMSAKTSPRTGSGVYVDPDQSDVAAKK